MEFNNLVNPEDLGGGGYTQGNGGSLSERIRAGTSQTSAGTAGGKWAEQDTPLCHSSLSGSMFVLPDGSGE